MPLHIQYTPDNSNLQETNENSSSYWVFDLSGYLIIRILGQIKISLS